MELDRYHRQVLLPQIGRAGQARLAAARVLLVGCGALGSVIADQLVRAGVGFVRIVDRDVVEWTNLQRQVLFAESDARAAIPKAVAARQRLVDINSGVMIEAVVADVHSGNIESLAGVIGDGPRANLILDGTDNVETRYLINDVSVKHSIPWVYGACVGTDGRMMPVLPDVTACLRCVFPEPPAGTELPTCDTAGVLGPVAGIVASMQSIQALKLLSGKARDLQPHMWAGDPWTGRTRTVAIERRADCPTCGRREFEFLSRPAGRSTSLCGRRSIQVRPASNDLRLDLAAAAQKLGRVGEVERTAHLVRCRLAEPVGMELTVFADGRLMVTGTTDPEVARSMYARYVGA